MSNSKGVLHVIRKLGVTGVLQGPAAAAKLAFENGGRQGLCDFMRDNEYLDSNAQDFIADVFAGKIKAKRGRKPKARVKPEKLVASKKRGRPKIHSERSKERLVKVVDAIKLKNRIKTDKDAIYELLTVYLGKSPREARQEFGRYKMLLTKARRGR